MPLDKSKMVLPVDPKVALAAYAADKRWQKETGGFEFNGLHIATDDRSKIMIAGAREAAKSQSGFYNALGDINRRDCFAGCSSNYCNI